MANPSVDKCICSCTFCTVPNSITLNVTSQASVMVQGVKMATINDFSFTAMGLCSSPSNPAVAAAQGAPQKCQPVTVSPAWAPGSPTVLVEGKAALNKTSSYICSYGGVIQTAVTPAVTVQIP